MRNWVRSCTVLFLALLAIPALAQPPDGPGKDGGPPPPRHERNPEIKQKLLELFDHNHDGTLDRNELMELRMTIREEFAPQGPDRRGPEGRGGPRDGEGRFSGPGDRGPGQRGPDGPRRSDGADRRGDWRSDGEARGPDGPPPGGPPHDGPPPGGPGPDREARGPEGRPGPDGRPPHPMFSPERMFKRFDANHDGQLSMLEFGQLTEFIREHRPMGPPPGGPDGRRFGRRGPDGPDRRPDGPPRGRDGRNGPPGPPPGADDRPPPGPEGPPPRAADEDKPGPDQATMNDAPSDDELSLEDAI